jgi:hypothetical protein
MIENVYIKTELYKSLVSIVANNLLLNSDWETII